MKRENRVTLTTVGPVDPFGNVALVDADRIAELSAFDWRVRRDRNGNYASRMETADGIRVSVLLHHVVIGLVPAGLQVDHRNLNTMDNRRSNLRLATNQQNAQNREKQRTAAGRFKGVCFDPKRSKWQVQARDPSTGRRLHLGYFDDEIAAARWYDDFARVWHGEFARLNFAGDMTAAGVIDPPEPGMP